MVRPMMSNRNASLPLLGAALLLGFVVAGCGNAPGPTGLARPSGPADESIAPLPSDALTGQLGGPWRRSPIVLDDPHIAIISDACATAARQQLAETEANLPTALVDARGEHFATAILADDLDAIECLVHLDETGLIATVDSVDRLSPTAVAPVDGTDLSVASVVHLSDRPGDRTIAFGRIGPSAESAKVGFDDASVILGADSEGWWAMWWRGTIRASGYSAVDTHDIVVGNAKSFEGEREARVGPAAWWIDPAGPVPTETSATIRALVREEECASGQSPGGRIDPPDIDLGDASITVTYWIRKPSGDVHHCLANHLFPIELKLPEDLGPRTLLDGGSTPPRDASKPPIR